MNELQSTEVQWRRIVLAINQLIRGRGNNVGSVTLTASSATTVVTPETRIMNEDAKVFFTPRTANASAEYGGGSFYVSAITRTSFTVSHANNAQSDRTFDYAIIGG